MIALTLLSNILLGWLGLIVVLALVFHIIEVRSRPKDTRTYVPADWTDEDGLWAPDWEDVSRVRHGGLGR
jgi:hypothetical protein